MKITNEDYQHIKSSIKSTIDSLGLANVMAYKQKLVDGEIKCNDPNIRLMYDLQRKAGLLSFVCDVIYKYADDSHYKTALLRVGKELDLT